MIRVKKCLIKRLGDDGDEWLGDSGKFSEATKCFSFGLKMNNDYILFKMLYTYSISSGGKIWGRLNATTKLSLYTWT